MGREIKFRAWYPYSLHNDNREWIGKMITDMSNAELFRMAEINTYDLMQYTGLKDKNGVEIYEVDIVRYEAVKNHPRTCTVVYEPKAAAFLLNDVSKGSINYVQMKYLGDISRSTKDYDVRTYELCEVIGNIYEAPELLNSDQPVGERIAYKRASPATPKEQP